MKRYLSNKPWRIGKGILLGAALALFTGNALAQEHPLDLLFQPKKTVHIDDYVCPEGWTPLHLKVNLNHEETEETIKKRQCFKDNDVKPRIITCPDGSELTSDNRYGKYNYCREEKEDMRVELCPGGSTYIEGTKSCHKHAFIFSFFPFIQIASSDRPAFCKGQYPGTEYADIDYVAAHRGVCYYPDNKTEAAECASWDYDTKIVGNQCRYYKEVEPKSISCPTGLTYLPNTDYKECFRLMDALTEKYYKYTLDYAVADESQGTIECNGGIDMNFSSGLEHSQDQYIECNASPKEGIVFAGWTAKYGKQAPCEDPSNKKCFFHINDDIYLVANFKKADEGGKKPEKPDEGGKKPEKPDEGTQPENPVIKPGDKIVRNPNGAWYDENKSGYGFSLVGTANGTFIYYYGFDRLNNPLWLLSEKSIESFKLGSSMVVKMQRYKNDGTAQDWGTLNISFDSCQKGQAELTSTADPQEPAQNYNLTPIISAGSICQETQAKGLSLKTQTIGNPSGAWFDNNLKGLGFNLITSPQGETYVYYYGFDKNGNHLWLLSKGALQPLASGAAQNIDMLVFAANGGKVGAGKDFGTLTLRLTSCQAGEAILKDKNGNLINEFKNLEIITPIEGFCQGLAGKLIQRPNGAWYDESKNGYGFSLVGTAVGSFIYYYGFDRLNNPLWLLSDKGIESFKPGSAMLVKMQRYAKGDGNPQDWGTLNISFDSCQKGQAELASTADAQEPAQNYTLTPIISAGNSCQETGVKNLLLDDPIFKNKKISNSSGAWADDNQKGVGFNLITSPQGETFAYYYGHDKNGNYLWLLSNGGFQPLLNGMAQNIDMLAFAVNGGKVGAGEKYATLNLRLTGCEAGEAVLKDSQGAIINEFKELKVIAPIAGFCTLN